MSDSFPTPSLPAPIELSMGVVSWRKEGEDPHDWRDFLNTARLYDRCGVDRLAISDHVVYGENLDEYAKPEKGGTKGGVQPTGPDGAWLEPLTTLGVLAGATSTIRLGTNILLAALRRPTLLAKMLSSLDVLSGGRLDIGVGVGWQREEYEAAGLVFEERGKLLDHSLEVCQVLWGTRRASYESERLSFHNIHMNPKPLQSGGVPIWVSGTVNPRVIRRVARFGTGWIPWGDAAADVVPAIAQMREGLSALGRDPSGLRVVGNLSPVKGDGGGVDLGATMEKVDALVDGGVTDIRVRLSLSATQDEAENELRSFVSAFRAHVGRDAHSG
jgi:probable F420-dependent oxidoreductase